MPAPVVTFRPHGCLRSVTSDGSLSSRAAKPCPPWMQVTKSMDFRRSSVTPEPAAPTSCLPLSRAGRSASKDACSVVRRMPGAPATVCEVDVLAGQRPAAGRTGGAGRGTAHADGEGGFPGAGRRQLRGGRVLRDVGDDVRGGDRVGAGRRPRDVPGGVAGAARGEQQGRRDDQDERCEGSFPGTPGRMRGSGLLGAEGGRGRHEGRGARVKAGRRRRETRRAPTVSGDQGRQGGRLNRNRTTLDRSRCGSA